MMPDQNKYLEALKKYPTLAHMETDDLKRLLLQVFDAPGDKEPDVTFMEAIMEVINAREAGTQDEITVDVDAALQRFHERLDKEQTNSAAETYENRSSNVIALHSKKAARFNVPRILRSTAVILLIFLATCGTASAFGINVFQAVAKWTAGTFHFEFIGSPEPKETSPQEDLFQELREAAEDATEYPVVPKWWPEGTTISKPIDIIESLGGTKLFCTCTVNSEDFAIRIHVHNPYIHNTTALYQKSNEDVITYQVNNVTHYIFKNDSRYTAAWVNGNVEVSIFGCLNEKELKKMIQSIYKET